MRDHSKETLMDWKLTREEIRIIGCLMEKAVVTPDQYPLTLNALTNACNQKSSRDPVMQLEQGVVQRTARGLVDQYLVSIREGQKAGVEKYTQRLCGTPMAKWHFTPAQYAVVCMLLLRGAQTPGELRARSGRLHEFADNNEVVETLETLISNEEGAIAARLPRRQGRQDHEYIHLLSGEVESVAEDATRPRESPVREDKIGQLEARIDALEAALTSLADRLGETINLAPPDVSDKTSTE